MNRNVFNKALIASVTAFAIAGSGTNALADGDTQAAEGVSNYVVNGHFTQNVNGWHVGKNTEFAKIGGVARILNVSDSEDGSVAMVGQCINLSANKDYDLTMRAWFTPGERPGKFVVRANFFSQTGCEKGALEGIDLFQTTANGWQDIDVPVKQWFNQTEPRSVYLTLRVQKNATSDPELVDATRSAMVDDIVIAGTSRTPQNPAVGEPVVPLWPDGPAKEPAAEEPVPPFGGPVTLVPPSPTAVPPSNPQSGSGDTPAPGGQPSGGAENPSTQPSATEDLGGSGSANPGQPGSVTTGGKPQANPTLFPQDPPSPQAAPPTLFPQDPPLPSAATPTPPPPATGGDLPLNPAQDLSDDPAAGGSVTAFATTDESLPILLGAAILLGLGGVGTALGFFLKRPRR